MPGIVKEQIYLTAFLTHHLPLTATQVSHFTSGIWRMHSNTKTPLFLGTSKFLKTLHNSTIYTSLDGIDLYRS